MSVSGGGVVIVGAGQAGSSAATMLRQAGYKGTVTLVGDELCRPYRRPPLSKAYLKGAASFDSLKLWPDPYYEQLGIRVLTGAAVEGIDPPAKRIRLATNTTLNYDTLILATGSRPRKLTIPGSELTGVHELRSVADADRLIAALARSKGLALIGGGYVGLEAAASARAMGVNVTVIEREARLLARVASVPLAHFFEQYHSDRGVSVLTSARVEELVDADGAVSGVRLDDGRVIPCDLVLVGIGAVSCDALALAAGLTCRNGVVVDEHARTSDASIFAIGDVTCRPLSVYEGRMFRLESVPNALEQARQAVNTIMELADPKPEVPWFWSDQYELKLQIAGIPFDSDDLAIRGSVAGARFTIFHLAGKRLVSAEAVNCPADFVVARKLIVQRTAVTKAQLTDPDCDLKQLAR
jgi:3-phenylpropionate/trans-cinnamate dioxygenase ferredoxin reductase subunit